ncbi:MAG TPA: hypothetical protein VL095_00120 [Flavisolibacter sp.]|nr:hypothetical protein [Flavisolibacter sp.]
MNKKINSLLSLQPLVVVLKKMITEGKPGAKKLYEGLIREIESKPGLLKPMADTSALSEDAELVETILSTIFPPSTSSNQGIYAITLPFRTETVYASPGFKQLFLKGDSNTICFSDSQAGIDVSKASLCLAYNLILRKFFSHTTSLTANSIHAFKDANGLTKYYDLKLNAQFVEVKLSNKDFELAEDFTPAKTLSLDELKELFPIENFQFEGLVVVEVNDVTQDQVIVEIKTALFNVNSFSDVSIYDRLQEHVQSLIGLKNANIGITPFFKLNDCYLYTEALYKNSILFKNEEVLSERNQVGQICDELFEYPTQPVLYEILNEASTINNKLLKYYFDYGARSLMLCPLKTDEGKLVGLLEIVSSKQGQLQLQHLAKLQPAIQLFALALDKSGESLELQIDKMIKEHFTAVQPVVEWKFTEAAFNYLEYSRTSEQAKMQHISFENVYPLYAAIDIRNSSTERSQAIQMDLLEQLNSAKDVLRKAAKIIRFPLLDETRFRTEKFIESVTDTLLSDDELVIYDFLQNDLDSLLKSLTEKCPELKTRINEYFSKLDPQRGVLYHHRKNYEESITRINDVLDRFIDNEQVEAQKIYPHYFERYLTDGIEFNIYIGQSLSPHHSFTEMYVRNLKLWQLNLLAKAARITYTMEKRLALPLQTTQLILAHSVPLTISFRRKERKFDVDGAYNIRYEIIKKRIDKVHLKNSEERLTQPGKIAIVYSQHKELEEYLEFIEYLQHEKLLGNELEHLDLEDTQGISGLKAVRVNVLLQTETSSQKPELSKTTSQQLLRK